VKLVIGIYIGEKAYESIEGCVVLVCLDHGITPEDIATLAPTKIVAIEEALEDSSVKSNTH